MSLLTIQKLESDILKLERRMAALKARLLLARARATQKDRAKDTRRKLLLGAALLDDASRNQEAARVIQSLLKALPRKQDLKAFEDWTLGDISPPNLHTRRKIILGGALIILAQKREGAVLLIQAIIARTTSDKDLKPFENWKPKSIATATGKNE